MSPTNILDLGNEAMLLCRITTLDAPEMTEALLKISNQNLSVTRHAANVSEGAEAFSLPLADIATISKEGTWWGWRLLKYTLSGAGVGILVWLKALHRGRVLPTAFVLFFVSVFSAIGIGLYYEIVSNKTPLTQYTFTLRTGQRYSVYVKGEAEAEADAFLRQAKLNLSV